MESAHAQHDDAAIIVDTATTETSSAVTVERDLGRWKAFLRDEDRRFSELRLGACLVTVGLGRAPDLEPALLRVQQTLRGTDRVAVLCADEFSVLLSPLAGIRDAQRQVQKLDAALRAGGLVSSIGWAMRLEGHDLFHAAARADAAMLTARGQGRLDLSRR